MTSRFLLVSLVLAGCALDEDPTLSTAESSLTVTQWHDDHQIPNQLAARQPALAYFKNRLHLIHSGSTYANELWWSKFDGTTWSTNVKLTATSDVPVRLAVFEDRLYMVTGHNGRVELQSTDGTTWTNPIGLNVSGRAAPSIAVHGTKLYLATCDWDDVMLDVLNGTGVTRVWTHTLNGNEFAACNSTTMASFGGKLHMIWNETQYATGWDPTEDKFDHPLHELIGVPGSYFVVDEDIGMRSENAPALVVCNGTAHLVHGGDDSPTNLWWSYQPTTSTSTGWSTNAQIQNQSSHSGVGLGCNAFVIPTMVHNGGSNNQLWWSEFQ
ncbi:MAG TPA: hypothetical protein VIV40_05485 [Kofleriaceae bacterium]